METIQIMALQLELLPTSPDNPILLKDIMSGTIAQIVGNKKIVMRIKPTGFLLNSNIIGDVINRGDVLIVDMAKGTLYCVHGDITVIPLSGKLQYRVKELG